MALLIIPTYMKEKVVLNYLRTFSTVVIFTLIEIFIQGYSHALSRMSRGDRYDNTAMKQRLYTYGHSRAERLIKG